jgi:hypothetical protein
MRDGSLQNFYTVREKRIDTASTEFVTCLIDILNILCSIATAEARGIDLTHSTSFPGKSLYRALREFPFSFFIM